MNVQLLHGHWIEGYMAADALIAASDEGPIASRLMDGLREEADTYAETIGLKADHFLGEGSNHFRAGYMSRAYHLQAVEENRELAEQIVELRRDFGMIEAAMEQRLSALEGKGSEAVEDEQSDGLCTMERSGSQLNKLYCRNGQCPFDTWQNCGGIRYYDTQAEYDIAHGRTATAKARVTVNQMEAALMDLADNPTSARIEIASELRRRIEASL